MARTSTSRARRLFRRSLAATALCVVALAPGAYEVAFPGLAHDDAVLDRILTAAERAATTLTDRT